MIADGYNAELDDLRSISRHGKDYLLKIQEREIEAMGFIIEKAFQHGGDFLRKEGIRYEALATVESLDDCKIVLK